MSSRRALPRLFALALVLPALWLMRSTLLAPPPIAVQTQAVERGRVELTVSNSRAGTVKARRRAKLSPEIGGRDTSITDDPPSGPVKVCGSAAIASRSGSSGSAWRMLDSRMRL